MKVGIMQPYFVPYIGYWQLINTVDIFVIHDDVNYIKQGWVNRNYILINGERHLIVLPLVKASSNKLINKISIIEDKTFFNRMLKSIELQYKKAPYFEIVYPIICRILKNNERNLAKFLEYSIREICNYLDINTKIINSSNMEKDNSLRSQERVIHICKLCNATEYINPIGGFDLYSGEDFLLHNIELSFLRARDIKYTQYKNDFVSFLSIIDIMMFNSVEKIKTFLNEFDLIKASPNIGNI